MESTLNAGLDIIDQQFARDDGLYEASLGEDWADLGSGPLQNPQMHLAEAFLQVLAVRDDEHTRQSLLQLCAALQAHFVEPAHGLMLEKPRGAVDNWYEPGHQFEWFYLLHTSPLLRDTPLHASIDRAFSYAEQQGVQGGAVLAMLGVDGQVLDATSASGHRLSTCVRWCCALAVKPGCLNSCRCWKRGSCARLAGTNAGMARVPSAGMTCLRLRPTTWQLAWKACSA